jgi:Raf kinase inhibitor-like YbhB/YbcL family protein
MELSSINFQDHGKIPARFTGEGDDISPGVRWSNVPKECVELALLVEDPDAPKGLFKDHPFVHWVAYNIPSNVSMLPEGIDQQERLEAPVPIDQGKNSMGHVGYNGPMPPPGHGTHHYIFTLFALDREIGLKPGLKKDDLLKAIDGHVIEKAQYIGEYERPFVSV